MTYQLDDYVVRGIVSYFAGAREWRTYHRHDGKQERWLECGATGRTWDGTSSNRSSAEEVEGAEGADEAPAEAGSATAGIESAAGRRDGVFVEYRRYLRRTDRAGGGALARRGCGCSTAGPLSETTSTYGQNQRSPSRLP